MIASGRVHIPVVNTSSVNGFWASIGPHLPQTAYAAAKFAVKGFTEALITDLRINAPHIKCSVVMPGHIWTSIPLNIRKVQSGNQADAMDATQLALARARFASMGRDASTMSDDDIRQRVAERERRFREEAPTSAARLWLSPIRTKPTKGIVTATRSFRTHSGRNARGTESLQTPRWREQDSNHRFPREAASILLISVLVRADFSACRESSK